MTAPPEASGLSDLLPETGRDLISLIENLSYRKFKEGDGLENAGQLTEGAKPYAVLPEIDRSAERVH